ncbi:ferritin-like domain-containing protein [Pelagicoccus sp. SDUM812003]|uniref:ferritin-like domain-containing protein n=1 Tax=Pelagicoccus sp. SDUM812003 TaxID=3041267 RepID=UPI0028103C4D|nr:ferritin-like domain-containing protein [Pelagicoccus sp. SDUM812003]MDQ8204001.1 ferritin-like domain-containing protein [Pelagicoccus sp. SDUM812003]
MDTKLRELFIDQLKDMYDAEHRILEALPSKIEAAESENLKTGLEEHLTETRAQIQRLERIFEIIEVEPERSACQATKGLIKEAKELLGDFEGSSANDAAIICAAQKVEHYEIATYGCLCSWSQRMKLDEAYELLEMSLTEEKRANDLLSKAAITEANEAANV